MGAGQFAAATGIGRGRLAAWGALVGSLASIAYAGRLSQGQPEPDVLYEYESAVGAAIQYGLVLAILLWIAAGLPKRELFALHRPTSWGRAALLALGTLVAIYAVTAVLEPLLHGGEEQGLTPDRWEPDRAGGYAANFVAVALIAPLVEELLFRGLGFTLVERFFGTRAAVGVTAVAFGLAHGLVAALPVLVAFGIGLGLIRARTGSLYPAIALHAVFNAIALVAAVVF